MAKPLIAVETIYAHALELIDNEGAPALNARRLAADLKISTRTLYQQVGNRDELIRALVARHFSQLQLDFVEYEDWETTALRWCLSFHDTLAAHPHLTELMTIEDRGVVKDYLRELVQSALRSGYPRALAKTACLSLVNVTINHTVVEVRALNDPERSPKSGAERSRIAKSLTTTLKWLLAGIRAELDA
ncbi:TetR/AcrR family transcriptional regulator [Mycobacteroides chelonae]|uniref:TetR/AcrR family transcriptional regulator n=1 Tax=Mycobacteroides chelonae TaxID=1774 RepID=UPI0008A9B4C4|nr:TetR/AcrR family transcriptional regulator [Mycobacteroides chelonae]OHU32935.1 hypothetical protein BKG78_17515 [Mycobacteroides chelonae]